MKFYLRSILILSTISVYFTGCSNNELDLSHKSKLFKKAYKDGCETAKGNYTKKHWAFNNRKDYYDGWFVGRNHCNK